MKPVVQTVNLFVVKKILDPLFERGSISIRARQITGSNKYLAEVVSNDHIIPEHLRILTVWPLEYLNPDDAINNLRPLLGITNEKI